MRFRHQEPQQPTLFDHAPERPYPQMVLESGSRLGLRDVFTIMSSFSGLNDARPALCRDFLPNLHLYLFSSWCVDDGIHVLHDDWRTTEQIMGHWVNEWGLNEQNSGCSAYLQRGHAIITPTPIAAYEPDLALEIVRKYA